MASQISVFAGQQEEVSDNSDKGQNKQQIRNNSLDTLFIERFVAECSALQTSENNSGNQIAGNDKEDVNTEEAAGNKVRKCVKY